MGSSAWALRLARTVLGVAQFVTPCLQVCRFVCRALVSLLGSKVFRLVVIMFWLQAGLIWLTPSRFPFLRKSRMPLVGVVHVLFWWFVVQVPVLSLCRKVTVSCGLFVKLLVFMSIIIVVPVPPLLWVRQSTLPAIIRFALSVEVIIRLLGYT